jgi:hypothetical protein
MALKPLLKYLFMAPRSKKVTGIRPFKIATMSLTITYERTNISPPATSEVYKDRLWAEQDFSSEQIFCAISSSYGRHYGQQ